MIRVVPFAQTECKQALSLPSCPCLSKQAQKKVFAALAAAGAAFSGTLMIMTQAVSIANGSLLLLSALLAYRAYHTSYNYQSTTEASSIRERIAKGSFYHALLEHGLTNILLHNLIPQEQLIEKITHFLKKQDAIQIARLHIELRGFQDRYRGGEKSYLTPRFKAALRRELAPHPVSDIFSWDNFSILIRSGLLSRDLLDAYHTWVSVKGIFIDESTRIKKHFENRINRIIDHVLRIAESCNPSERRAREWKDRIVLDLKNVRMLSFSPEAIHSQNHPSLTTISTLFWDELKLLQQAQAQLVNEFADAKAIYEHEKERIHSQKNRAIEQLNAEFSD